MSTLLKSNLFLIVQLIFHIIDPLHVYKIVISRRAWYNMLKKI
jgi:hypothetical protein